MKMMDTNRWRGSAIAPRYQISRDGRVFSCDRGRQCKLTLHSSGRLVVGLKIDGRRRIVYVHKLVAEAFCPNPFLYRQVTHLDGDMMNNNYLNLKFVPWDRHRQCRVFRLKRKQELAVLEERRRNGNG